MESSTNRGIRNVPVTVTGSIRKNSNEQHSQKRFEWHGVAQMVNGIMRKFVADDGKFTLDINFLQNNRGENDGIRRIPIPQTTSGFVLENAEPDPSDSGQTQDVRAHLTAQQPTNNLLLKPIPQYPEKPKASSFKDNTPLSTPPGLQTAQNSKGCITSTSYKVTGNTNPESIMASHAINGTSSGASSSVTVQKQALVRMESNKPPLSTPPGLQTIQSHRGPSTSTSYKVVGNPKSETMMTSRAMNSTPFGSSTSVTGQRQALERMESNNPPMSTPPGPQTMQNHRGPSTSTSYRVIKTPKPMPAKTPAPLSSQFFNTSSSVAVQKQAQMRLGPKLPVFHTPTPNIFPPASDRNSFPVGKPEIRSHPGIPRVVTQQRLMTTALTQKQIGRMMKGSELLLPVKEEPVSPVPMQNMQPLNIPLFPKMPILLNQMGATGQFPHGIIGKSLADQMSSKPVPHSSNILGSSTSIISKRPSSPCERKPSPNRLLFNPIRQSEGGPYYMKKRRERRSYSLQEVDILESYFQLSSYPSLQTQRDISSRIDVNPERVKVWFKNRRAKDKRRGIEPHTRPVNVENLLSDVKVTSHDLISPCNTLAPTLDDSWNANSTLEDPKEELLEVKPEPEDAPPEIMDAPVPVLNISHSAVEQNVLSMLDRIKKDFR